jgi:alkylation response protein AidB-like acyl-CoA dehydrogenase
MHWFEERPNVAAPRPEESGLRLEVRRFLDGECKAGGFVPRPNNWVVFDREFSIRCAERGYVGTTLPKQYGGGGKSARERLVICEEMLAAGAPLGSHWIADRQSAPQILRHGSEALRARLLPEIAAGRCTFAIGMSEPDSGSDLSSIRTAARKVDGGWRLDGRKVWTTNAHHADYMIVLCRTAPRGEDRYAGLSQLVVEVASDGVTVRPIRNLAGEHELNEVIFEGAFVPDDNLLGKGGDGWQLVNEELGFERSGPDRFLSTYPVLRLLVAETGKDPDRYQAVAIGQLLSRLLAVRSLSHSIADLLANGERVILAATMMKDIGTALEQEIPQVAGRLLEIHPDPHGSGFAAALAAALLNAPSFTIRGGTREILKGIVARELGLR